VQACRSKHLVDYAEVTAVKLSILERLFDACRSAAASAAKCLFLALREHFAHE